MLQTDITDIDQIRADLSRKFPGLMTSDSPGWDQSPKLGSCIREIDDFLGGGLPFNGITEFGMPLGKEGRTVLLKFLVNATRGLQAKPIWTLWVSSHQDFSVFPPAWFAKGVSPSRMIFSSAAFPAQELKRAIINPLFKLIVLDSPQRFTREDCFFINSQARFNQQLVILLRNFFLSNKCGNVWAKLRFNCWKQHARGKFIIKTVKGLPRRQIVVDEESLS
ncbi:hypothetical protein KJ966_27510 [bacterium]|nr:hypothetical protein [bacterium]